MPLISICVTVYNLENYISECLDSILNQDFEDYELIVVDNGSTDKSVDICEKYQNLHPDKMKFIKFPPPTIFGRSAYVAFSQAAGDYIHSIDGDDYVAADYLKNISKIIESRKPDLIIGSFIGVAEEGLAVFKDVSIDANEINEVPCQRAIKYLFSLPYFNKPLWRFIAKSSFYYEPHNEFKIVNSTVYGDGISPTLWLLSCRSIYYYDGPFYFYRRRHNSITSIRDNRCALEFFRMILHFQASISLFYNEIENPRFDLVLPYVLCHYKIIEADYDMITAKEIFEINALINENRTSFNSLRVYNIGHLDRLVDLVSQYGNIEGFSMSFEYEIISFLSKLQNCLDKDIYVFPTGRFGEGTGRLLKKWGFRLRGFLDNDVSKSTLKFLDLPCSVPMSLNSLSPIQKENTAVVIATIYDKLFPKLKQQVLESGINDKSIIIRE